MGQQLCTVSSTLYANTLQNYPSNQSQLPLIQDNDNPVQLKLSGHFLNTSIVASWNILQQKQSNTVNNKQNNTMSHKIKQKTISSHNSHNKNKIVRSKQQYYQKQMTYEQLNKKKYRQSVKPEYQNIQIDISGFIKVRNQNINDFYDFAERVGEGSFGNVYKAYEKKTKQVRAIKALKKTSMSNAFKRNFAAQIDLLKTLDHPNIIKLYDLFLYDGNYYVVTQFCEGGCLQKFYNSKKKQITEQISKQLMKQLLSALYYLNNNNIVHRDLKLQNIVFMKKPNLVDKENPLDLQVKIIDFGTAIRVEKHRKNPSSLVGTLFYMAPQFSKGFFTQKCDIWSSGVILYQLLFKQLPFKGKNEKQILNAIANKQLNWIGLNNKNSVSQNAIQFLKSMLDRNYLTRSLANNLLKNEWLRSVFNLSASKDLSDSAAMNLTFYHRRNNFVSLIQSFLSFKKITQQQRQQLSKIFIAIDSDNSGLIDSEQLFNFLIETYPDLNHQDIKNVILSVDKNNSGKLEFNEFLTVMIKRNQLFAESALKQGFQFVDMDKTGFISKAEVKILLKMANKKQIQEVFNNLDENGDNQISFEQFKKYLLEYEADNDNSSINIQQPNKHMINK